MIDHCSFSVKNYQESLNFYDDVLGTLGYARIMTLDIPEHDVMTAGYGSGYKPFFWIGPMGKADEEIGRARGMHIAFLAPTIQSIHEWYAKGLALGAQDNGAPGPRPEYHPGYYGAFLVDPNGWRIEACLHTYKQGG